jgi:hypothetical protein
MKKIFFALTCAIFVTVACETASVVSTIDPNALQTAIISTALAAQNQTQTAVAPSSTPISTNTKLPANTPQAIETLLAPVSYTYDGTSLSCIMGSLRIFCMSNPSFTVKLTIDPQGNITGIFEQYTDFWPAVPLTGIKTNIVGSVENINKEYKGDFMDFTGSLTEDLKTLNVILIFRGPNSVGKRVLLFSRE